MNQALPAYPSYRDIAQQMEVRLFPMNPTDGVRRARNVDFVQQLYAMAIVYGKRLPEFLMAGAAVAQRHSLSRSIDNRFHATRLAGFVFAQAAAKHEAGEAGYAAFATHMQAVLFKSISAISAAPFLPQDDGGKTEEEQRLDHSNDRHRKTLFADYLALMQLGDARFGANELRDVFYNDALALAANVDGRTSAETFAEIAVEAAKVEQGSIAALVKDTVTDCLVRGGVMQAPEAVRACLWMACLDSPLQDKARSLFPYVWERALSHIADAPDDVCASLETKAVGLLEEAREMLEPTDALLQRTEKIYRDRSAVLRLFPPQPALHKAKGGCGKLVVGENMAVFAASAEEVAAAKPSPPTSARRACGRLALMSGLTPPPAAKLPLRKSGEPTLH